MPKTYDKRWQTVRELIPGGQAFTYVVVDLNNSGKEYVLKRLKNPKRIQRFEQEIRAISELDHPHIIRLVDSQLSGDEPYLVTEYCEGGELTQDWSENRSITEKLRLIETITAALAHAHEHGIIHRDIKPSNILFNSKGMAIIADFGICFSTDSGFERVTEFQEQVGARFYMAPELADGRLEQVTPAADVYSVGKLLYWLLAGRMFDREKHTTENWDLRRTNDDPAVLTIYDKIFSKTIVEEPSSRFTDAKELHAELKSVIETLQKEGRYLDAHIPQECLFCRVGKYLTKQIVPRVSPQSPNARLGRIAEYVTDYWNVYNFGNHPRTRDRLPAGNIENGNFESFLILECDYCGNVQFFRFNDNNTPWKNARPAVNHAG